MSESLRDRRAASNRIIESQGGGGENRLDVVLETSLDHEAPSGVKRIERIRGDTE